jgi:hypothetical protein
MRRSVLSLVLTTACVLVTSPRALAQDGEDADPPEVAIGERLFLETRFAQFFFTNSGGNVNATLASGDPAVNSTVTTSNLLAGPFAGQSMNCRACHLVDEHNATAGNRTYCDFARRSPIPNRGDGRTVTPRNSPALVGASSDRRPFFLHFDGDFATARDLVKGTLTGRNYGWLATEQAAAIAHIANVIRNDDGTGDLAQQFGGSYRVVLAGTDPSIPAEFRLPKKFRINVDRASDKHILNAVAALVEAYLKGLEFATDDNGAFNSSPYDVFLAKNGLPRQPTETESEPDYSRRLLRKIQSLSNPQFVSDADGSLTTHNQPFQFGPTELAGLKIFLTEPAPGALTSEAVTNGGIGNCVACHAAPAFTDFRFHNTGATQEEYDSIHGQGAFVQLAIPSLAERKKNYDAFLQPTPKHPNASGRFVAVPSVDTPGYVDLGLWNVFANSDVAKPQLLLRLMHVEDGKKSFADLLPQMVARFKTPSLRDLGHSGPYLHTGRMDTLEDVVNFYLRFSEMSRAGSVRNDAPELQRMAITESDVEPLAAFLRALNEDYN